MIQIILSLKGVENVVDTADDVFNAWEAAQNHYGIMTNPIDFEAGENRIARGQRVTLINEADRMYFAQYAED